MPTLTDYFAEIHKETQRYTENFGIIFLLNTVTYCCFALAIEMASFFEVREKDIMESAVIRSDSEVVNAQIQLFKTNSFYWRNFSNNIRRNQ